MPLGSWGGAEVAPNRHPEGKGARTPRECFTVVLIISIVAVAHQALAERPVSNSGIIVSGRGEKKIAADR